MELNRVVIVVKPLARPCRGTRRVSAGTAAPLCLRREHADALDRIVADLDTFGITSRVIAREDLTPPVHTDLIVPLGGDGTFLAASHAAGDIPLLGVNPDRSASVGFFCITETAGFGRILKQVQAGKKKPLHIPLIETHIGVRRLPVLALNDVLFAGRSPAETARYFLTISGKMEYQRSSGIWIAAGPGSTAAIQSAGGKAQGITSKKLQYVVREPCPMPGVNYKHVRGCLQTGKPITIASAMEDSVVYIDGPACAYPVLKGAQITCRISPRTLKVFL
jgi:NAD+ kinase